MTLNRQREDLARGRRVTANPVTLCHFCQGGSEIGLNLEADFHRLFGIRWPSWRSSPESFWWHLNTTKTLAV